MHTHTYLGTVDTQCTVSRYAYEYIRSTSSLNLGAIESAIQTLYGLETRRAEPKNVCRVLPHNSPDLRESSGHGAPSLSSNPASYA